MQVRLRFGGGLGAVAPDRPSYGWLGGLVAPSGLAGLDLDAMERLLTGRRMGLAFAVDEDAFVLAGQTNAADLHDQLRLLTAKLTHPRWDPGLFARFRSAAVESFDLHFSSAAARAAREMGGVIRPNDQRWRPIEQAEMEAVTVEQFQRLLRAAAGDRAGPCDHRRRHGARGRGARRCGARWRRCRAGPSRSRPPPATALQAAGARRRSRAPSPIRATPTRPMR